MAFVPWALNRRNIHPLVELRLFQNRNMTVAVLAMMLFAIAFFGASLLFPLYFIQVRGEDALGAGLLLAPQGIGAMLTMPVAGILADRIGPGKIVLTGITVITVGMAMFTQIDADTSYAYMLGALFIMGLGMGGTMMPIMTAALATLTAHNVARGSTLLNITQQVAASIGTALFSVILTNQIKDSAPAGAYLASRSAEGDQGVLAAIAREVRPAAGRVRGLRRVRPGDAGRRVRDGLHRGDDPGRVLPHPGGVPAPHQGGPGRPDGRDGSLTLVHHDESGPSSCRRAGRCRVRLGPAAEPERQHRGRTRLAQRDRGQGGGPAGLDLVVDEQHRRPGRHLGVETAATAYGGDALRRVGLTGARRDGVVADRPRADDRHLHDPRQALAEVARQLRPGRGLRRRRSPSGRDDHCDDQSFITSITAWASAGGTGPSGAPSRKSSRSAWPWPRSVSRATTRPVSAPAVILPLRSTPRLASAVGHILRGSIATPGRESRWPASATEVSLTDVERVRPPQLSQRPQSLASGSSSCSRR